MKERRHARRLRKLKGGSITFGHVASIDCIIRDLSKTGAALEVASPVGIPDDFKLLIRSEMQTRDCRVVWRSVNRIGIRFVTD